MTDYPVIDLDVEPCDRCDCCGAFDCACLIGYRTGPDTAPTDRGIEAREDERLWCRTCEKAVD